MKYFILIVGLFAGSLKAQVPTDWTELGEVRYMRGVDLRTGYMVEKPRFSGKIKRMADQEIEISGYMLPLDAEGKTYAISRYPYAACFFCGGGGLESVMNVWFLELDQRYSVDDYVKLQGTLRLNDNGDGLIYLLEGAEEIE